MNLRTGLSLLAAASGLGVLALRYRYRKPWQPKWVAEAMRAGQNRYEAVANQSGDPAHNGYLIPIIRSYHEQAEKTELGRLVEVWNNGYSSYSLNRFVDHEGLSRSNDADYSAAQEALGSLMPEVLSVLRRPLFLPPPFHLDLESAKKYLCWHPLLGALLGYAQALAAEQRTEESRELLEALLTWAAALTRGPSAFLMALLGAHLREQAIFAWLALFRPSLQDSPKRLQQASDLLPATAPDRTAYLNHLENWLAEGARTSKWARSQTNWASRILDFFGVMEHLETMTQNSTAYLIAEERPPYFDPQEPRLGEAYRDGSLGDQHSFRDRLLSERRVLLTLSLFLRLLARRAEEGSFPTERPSDAHIPTLDYWSDGQELRLSIASTRIDTGCSAWLDSLYGRPDWLEFEEGRVLIHWPSA